MTLAWHFTGATLRDGSPIPPVGETLRHTGDLVICESGLHGSERLIDALTYAPGPLPLLHRTQHGGTILRQDDKLCSETRTILWSMDATEILRRFARACALDVAHLWDMPPVVRQFLETGDETLRDAAGDAAWAAKDAAWAAAGDAAWAAKWAAAWAAAGDAARNAQNKRLTEMVMAETSKRNADLIAATILWSDARNE